MRIGMKETCDQDLFQISAEHFFGQCSAIEFHVCQRSQLGDLCPDYEFHRENARGTVVNNWQWHDQVGEIAQLFVQGCEVLRFLAVIELLEKAAPKLFEKLAKFVAFP